MEEALGPITQAAAGGWPKKYVLGDLVLWGNVRHRSNPRSRSGCSRR